MALKRAVLFGAVNCQRRLLGAGVLGNSLGSLADSVLRQLARQQQTHSGLNFSARDGGSFVVVSQARRFGSNALENIVNKAVHDAHCLAGNASVRVDLLQHLVDVDAVALLPPPVSLLIARALGFGLRGGFLCSFTSCFRWCHDSVVIMKTGRGALALYTRGELKLLEVT